jgi:hypothetical protein
MGYKRKTKVYVLRFEDEEYEGLEVRAKGASVEQLISLMNLARFGTGAKFGQGDIKEVDALFELFASKLTEWNLEDEDGVPVELSLAGLKSQDIDFALDVVLAWVGAVMGTSAPLEKSSPDGEQFPEGSIPMETLSSSL